MPQEFFALRCFACEKFQVHQVKKAKKWECKVCGGRQSLKKAYLIGSSKDCRTLVQKLNYEDGERKAQLMQQNIACEEILGIASVSSNFISDSCNLQVELPNIGSKDLNASSGIHMKNSWPICDFENNDLTVMGTDVCDDQKRSVGDVIVEHQKLKRVCMKNDLIYKDKKDSTQYELDPIMDSMIPHQFEHETSKASDENITFVNAPLATVHAENARKPFKKSNFQNILNAAKRLRELDTV